MMNTSNSTTPPRALVINDDPSQLYLASAILAKDGFCVLPCHSSEEALRLMSEQGPVDVIVTDLYMPGIDGWRLCRLLRSPEYAAFNMIPILVVSATFSGTEAEEVTVKLGANAFLAAPYEPAALRARVRDLLAGRRPQAATHVLIVDSSPEQAQSLRRTFEAHGYTTVYATTGEEGRRLF